MLALYEKMARLTTGTVEEGYALYNEILREMRLEGYLIQVLDNYYQPIISNAKLQNITEKGFTIAVAYSAEGFWYAE